MQGKAHGARLCQNKGPQDESPKELELVKLHVEGLIPNIKFDWIFKNPLHICGHQKIEVKQNQTLLKPMTLKTKSFHNQKLTKPSQKLIQSTSHKVHETKKDLTKAFEITPWKFLAIVSFTTLSCIYSLMLQHLSHTHTFTHAKKWTHGEAKKCIKIVHLWILP